MQTDLEQFDLTLIRGAFWPTELMRTGNFFRWSHSKPGQFPPESTGHRILPGRSTSRLVIARTRQLGRAGLGWTVFGRQSV